MSDFACIGSASRLRIDEGRICLDLSLHAYPRTTNAWVHLPSCVPSLLTATPWVGSSEDSPLANRIELDADMVVLEYQPVVHRLRLSASP